VAVARPRPRRRATARSKSCGCSSSRKKSAVKSRTQAINQLKSVPVSADTTLRESLAGLSNPHLFKRCAELDDSQECGPAGTARHMRKLLADRIQHLTGETDDLNKRTAAGVEANFPGLLDTHGVGPDSAATLLISAGDNPDRLSSEASFTALCGAGPVEASSGKTQRRRLNHGGHRQANAALYRIVLSRLRWDDRTQDYLRRRLAEGKTRREIIRRLKRYVAREIYRLIAPIRTAACPAEPNATAMLTSIEASTASQANSALHTIVLARLRWETRSRSYVERRIAEGKMRHKAIRRLKRYAARELCTIIIRAHALPHGQALAA
jgi:hypothetical protein